MTASLSFLAALVRRDLALRYKGSLLGAAWTLLHPAALVAVYTFLFAGILRIGGEDYPLFVLAGLLPWLWFAAALTSGLSCVLSNGSLVRTALFPRLLLPISVIGSHGVHFLVSLALVLPVAAWCHGKIPSCWLALLPLSLLLALFLLGLLSILVPLNVFIRDVGQAVNALLRLVFFLTPVVYPVARVPEPIRGLLLGLNPLAGIVGAYQDILYRGVWPGLLPLIPAAGVTVLLLLAGLTLFQGLEGRFVEEL